MGTIIKRPDIKGDIVHVANDRYGNNRYGDRYGDRYGGRGDERRSTHVEARAQQERNARAR